MLCSIFLRLKRKDPRMAPSPSPCTFKELAAKPLPDVYATLENGAPFLRLVEITIIFKP